MGNICCSECEEINTVIEMKQYDTIIYQKHDAFNYIRYTVYKDTISDKYIFERKHTCNLSLNVQKDFYTFTRRDIHIFSEYPASSQHIADELMQIKNEIYFCK